MQNTTIKNMLRWILTIAEPIILLAMILAYWHHSPPIRDEWVWMLGLAIPIFALRFIVHRRLFVANGLSILMVLFIIMSVYNYTSAPWARDDYWVIICRPLLGFWIIAYMMETAQLRQWSVSLIGMLGIGFVLGFVALTTTVWVDKSAVLEPLIDIIPRINHREILPDMRFGFNPNEIAGALAWTTPLLLGLSLYSYPKLPRTVRWILRAIAIVALITNGLALGFGQSRFALAGVFIGLTIVTLCGIRGRVRWVMLGILGVLLTVQVMVFLNIGVVTDNNSGESTATLSNRDQSTLGQRFIIWNSSLNMIRDYPTTGVGMSMFYLGIRQDAYTHPVYEERGFPPHAHNELLQMGTDFGAFGILWFIAWHGVLLYALWRGWKQGDANHHTLVLAILGGLLAHTFYGLGDAVKIWDRFAFIGWCMAGLAMAQWIHIRPQNNDN